MFDGSLLTFTMKLENSGGVSGGVSDEEAMILEYCNVPRSITEIQQKSGYKSRNYLRTKIINRLLESGILVYTIPDKPNSRLQKYMVNKTAE